MKIDRELIRAALREELRNQAEAGFGADQFEIISGKEWLLDMGLDPDALVEAIAAKLEKGGAA